MAKAKTDLVIVESPAKARTIEKYLGTNYKVVASMGHLRDLPKSKMGVDIEKGFEPMYQPVKEREDVINDLRKKSKSAGTVSAWGIPSRDRPWRNGPPAASYPRRDNPDIRRSIGNRSASVWHRE